MTEITTEEEINQKVKKNFIINSIFGQKLINGLTQDKKKEVNIDYFLSHIKHFNIQKKESWEDKINFKKHIDSIPNNIQDRLKSESDIIVKKLNTIEPYCKKQIKIIPPINVFKKNGFHHRLVKLESTFYDLVGMIYYNDSIVGYICCGKKTNGSYKNIYIVINHQYDKDFFDKSNKKLSIINEITEEIAFFEKDTYHKYLKNFRNVLFTTIFEILSEHKSIKNIVCIGEEEGGNILQLFLVDLVNNKSDINVKITEDISFYLFTSNTAMLSTETFYLDLINYLGGSTNSLITSFDDKNRAYDSWDIDENKKMRYNIIVLNSNDL